jgi:hypothetical protein
MTLLVPHSFCIALFSQENILLDIAENQSPTDETSLNALLHDIDAALRDEAPYAPPPLDLQAAKWSLGVLYWGCKTLLNRFETRTQLPDYLSHAEPDGRSIGHHWSVDIGLRFLSDLIRRTAAAAADDSLIATLLGLGASWPYSSIGTNSTWNDERLQLILSDPCLRHLLFDRIEQRRDVPHSQLTQLAELYQRHIALPQSTL